MQLIFKYDIEKDIDNYLWALIDKKIPSYGRNMEELYLRLLPSCVPKLNINQIAEKQRSEQRKLIKKYIENNLYKKEIIDANLKSLAEIWSDIGAKYLDRLVKYFEIKDFSFENVTCYLTTLTICPHGENYFFTSAQNGLDGQIKTAMHETMHLVFLKYYKNDLAKRGLTQGQIQNIKEALVELLNLEFKDICPIREIDYKPSAENLKAIIRENHKKPFPELLELLIKESKQ